MNKIDYEFYSLIKKLELMSKEEVYLNIKNRYLSLNEELRGNIETFLNSFNYWGKLDYINNDFEEIKLVVNLLKNNLTDLVVFYQSLKGGLAYKKEFENFKNSHKHYETMVDGGYWVGVMVAMAVLAFVLMFMAPKLASNGQTYYYYLAYGCIGLVFLGLAIDSYTHRRIYFTEEGFFFEDTYYRYRMLANFEFKNGIVARNCNVLMSNRDKIVVTKKIGEA